MAADSRCLCSDCRSFEVIDADRAVAERAAAIHVLPHAGRPATHRMRVA